MAVICPLFLSCGFGCIPLTLMSAEAAALVHRKLQETRSTVSSTSTLVVMSLFVFIGLSDSLNDARAISRSQ